MVWSTAESGTHEANLDGAETVYRKTALAFAAHNREHWRLHTICRFSFGPAYTGTKDPESALRRAWKALRLEFPGMIVKPVDPFKKQYQSPDVETTEAWLSQTFVVETKRTADEIIAEPVPLQEVPSLHYLPATSEIIFLISHWRIDAMGSWMMTERFFDLLAHPSADPLPNTPPSTEFERISPSFEDAAGSPQIATREMEQFATEHIARFHKNAIHMGGLPYQGDMTTPPGSPAREKIAFTPATTENLLLECRQRGITVTAAIHAALAEAVFALGLPESKQNDYVTVMPVNFRPNLASQYNTAAHALQTYAGSITPRVARHSTFAERTVYLTSFYKERYDPRLFEALRPLYKRHAEALFKPRPPPANGASNGEPLPPPKPPSGVSLNSLGIVEKFFKGDYGDALSVPDFTFGVSMITRQTMLYVWTWKGHLTLSTEYNAAYHNADEVQEVMRFIKDVLERELKLDMKLAS
ncbi:hypothetical protein BDW59DRAFT_167336 [Aspergillus cavernicola]|uniref:Alcohol acetyltransferase n=1 Tax=Aspergillus cavernicola TaxID=176166 RepID=A0ABR4HET7_9EURO